MGMKARWCVWVSIMEISAVASEPKDNLWKAAKEPLFFCKAGPSSLCHGNSFPSQDLLQWGQCCSDRTELLQRDSWPRPDFSTNFQKLSNLTPICYLFLLPICYRVLQEIIHCKSPGANNNKTLAGLCTFWATLAENLFLSSVSKASRGVSSPSHAMLLWLYFSVFFFYSSGSP